MNQNEQFVTLDSIIKEALVDIGESSLHRYQQFLQWGWRGVIDHYNTETSGFIKSIETAILPNKTIVVPSDFIDVWRIFVRDGNTLMCLMREDDAVSYPSNVTNTNIENPDDWIYCLIKGENGIMDNEWFKLYRELGIIQFAGNIATDTIVMEYLSLPLENDESTKVHVYAKEMILAFIHLQRVSFQGNLGEIQIFDRRFKEARRRAKARLQPISTQKIKKIKEKYLGTIR